MDGRIKTLGIIVLSLCACGPADDEFLDDEFFDDALEFRGDRLDTGLVAGGGGGSTADPGRGGGGGWISNSLALPNVSGIQPSHGLDSTLGMAEAYGLLTTTEGRKTAEYLVECALPADHSITKTIDGQSVVFYGHLGLAPQWESGSCDNTCQAWVSACLLARTNVTQQPVDLWLQADHPAIGFGLPPSGEAMVLEGSYYGNLFWAGSYLHFCEGEEDGMVASVREGRTCASGSCGFTNYGSCTTVADRCTMGGPNGDVPIDCRSDMPLYGPTWPTISTYLPAE